MIPYFLFFRRRIYEMFMSNSYCVLIGVYGY